MQVDGQVPSAVRLELMASAGEAPHLIERGRRSKLLEAEGDLLGALLPPSLLELALRGESPSELVGGEEDVHSSRM